MYNYTMCCNYKITMNCTNINTTQPLFVLDQMQTCTITLLHLSTHKTFFLSFRQYLKNWANRNFKAFFAYLNTPFTTADSKTFQVFLLYESSHLSLFQFYLMKAANILQKYCIFYCVQGMWCTWSFKKGRKP